MNILIKILQFLSGVGVFLFAMKILSQGLERSAGGRIRKLFAKISQNRLVGVGVGAGVTALIQSSSATTVMVLGFVNAGLMSLFQATSVIMGANIGTTVTAVLIFLKTFAISNLFAAFTVAGALMVLFAKRERLRAIGWFISGVGLIFVGLEIMSGGMSFLSESAAFKSILVRFSNPLLVVLAGMLLTAAIQSSSAMTGIVVTLVSLKGGSAISLAVAFYLMMGANTGTCITALIASIGGGINTKRTAFIHLVFNFIGVLIFLPLIALTRGGVENLFLSLARSNYAGAIALFHIVFNVLITFLLLPFINLLVKLAELAVPKGKKEEGEKRLRYLDERILSTPSLAITQVVKEIMEMQKHAETNFKLSVEGLIEGNNQNREDIEKREEHIDFLNHAISGFMVKISSLNVTDRDEDFIAKLFHIINDIERIGDHSINLSNYTENMLNENITFSQEAKKEISEIAEKVEEMLSLTFSAFVYKKELDLAAIAEKGKTIEEIKERYIARHIKRLSEERCFIGSDALFFSILNDFKRISDHLINISARIDPDYDIRFKRVIRRANAARQIA
jgi:phosphate:Na+ symporter